MKSVCIIPIKSVSKRVGGKNFRKVKGKPLFHYILDTVKKAAFDEIYVDTDSSEVKEYANLIGYKIIDRVPALAEDTANGNDLLNYHAQLIEADIYYQVFATAPLLKLETINKAISILKNSEEFDSVFTAEKIFSWFWFNGQPVNYDPKVLPRSQDATPIIKESTGLYGIRRESLLTNKCRIGINPKLIFIDRREGIDLDDDDDFYVLDSIINRM